MTGKEQLVRLSGKSADPEFINRIIKVSAIFLLNLQMWQSQISIDHDDRILYIDTVVSAKKEAAAVAEDGERFVARLPFWHTVSRRGSHRDGQRLAT